MKIVFVPSLLLPQQQLLFPVLNPAIASKSISKIVVLLAKSTFVAVAITDRIIARIIAHCMFIHKPPNYNVLPLNNLLCDNIFNCYKSIYILLYVQW